MMGPILQKRKWDSEEVRRLAQGHTAGKAKICQTEG